MADISAVAAAYSNAGVATVNIGANFKKAHVVYPTGTSAGASPYSQFGTRELVFLKATAGSGTPFTSGTIDDAGSDYQAAIQALQNFGELYHVQRVSDTVIAFAMSTDTLDIWDTVTNTNADYAKIETDLGAAVSGGLTFTVSAATLS